MSCVRVVARNPGLAGILGLPGRASSQSPSDNSSRRSQTETVSKSIRGVKPLIPIAGHLFPVTRRPPEGASVPGSAIEMLARGQFVESLEITGSQFPTDPVLLAQPLSDIQQATPLGAEWAHGSSQPWPPAATLRARHLGKVFGGVHRFNQRRRALRTRLRTRHVMTGK